MWLSKKIEEHFQGPRNIKNVFQVWLFSRLIRDKTMKDWFGTNKGTLTKLSNSKDLVKVDLLIRFRVNF
jgi:hypothetical protein